MIQTLHCPNIFDDGHDETVIDLFTVIGFFLGFWRFLVPVSRIILRTKDEG